MSKVAIQGNASGTGTFTIAAPNSNTDRTLTLPDEAGTVLTSGGDGSSLTNTGGIGGLQLINTTVITASVSSVSFDNLSTDYDSFKVIFQLHPNTDNVGLYVNFIGTDGTVITSGSLYSYALLQLDDGNPAHTSNAADLIRISGADIGNAQHEGVSGFFDLTNRNFDGSNDQHGPHIHGISTVQNTLGSGNHFVFSGGLGNNPAPAIRGIRLILDSGTIEEGKISLYGYAK